MAHQPASDKNGPDVHLIPLTTIGSGAMRGENVGRLTHKQRRALGHIWPANTFCISRHDAGKSVAEENSGSSHALVQFKTYPLKQQEEKTIPRLRGSQQNYIIEEKTCVTNISNYIRK